MRIALAFPPSLCLPNHLYYGLVTLAGIAKAAGHPVVTGVDLNQAAAEALLTERQGLLALQFLEQRLIGLRGAAQLEAAERLEALRNAVQENLRAAPEHVRVLRDPADYFVPERFARAFWGVVDALGFYYQLDPIISPFREHFLADVDRALRADTDSPMPALYEQGLLDEVLARDPELVCLTLAFPEQVLESFRLARLLKRRRPGIHIALGGPMLNVKTERWFEQGWIFDSFDSVFVGDAGQALPELIESLDGRRARESVTNLLWRDTRGTVRRNTEVAVLDDLRSLPLPDFEPFDLKRAFTPRPIYPAMLSRGCYWGRCTFCSIGWRENYRVLPPERIRDLARLIAAQPAARFVGMADSSVPPAAARQFSQVIRDERLGLVWEGGMKFAKPFLDADYVETLAAGGCRSLKLGFESASQRVLDLMDKGVQLAEIPRMLEQMRRVGISPELFWFIGFPTESRREALQTLEWLLEHRQLYDLTGFVGDYQLHPDTEVFDHPERYGVTVVDQDNGYCRYVLAVGLQQDELQVLKRLLACNNNRTLICNGSHLLHVAELGPASLRGLERPMQVPTEVRVLLSEPVA